METTRRENSEHIDFHAEFHQKNNFRTALRSKVHKQLVRPALLEYMRSVYDPLVQTLEAVQKRCAGTVYNISKISITSLLKTLDLEPLAKRRADRRLILFRAMHFGEAAAKTRDHLTSATNHHQTRRHPFES